MKQTAGSLRLELAQYRELAGFAQFASDLDAATKRQLERGHRLMQIMKQGVHKTLPVAKQIAIMYAGTNGYLDDLPINKVGDFEQQMYEALDREPREYIKLVTEKKVMTDEVKAALDRVLEQLTGKKRAKS
jgi:F-type H+-transporting ATPase subunit alpha